MSTIHRFTILRFWKGIALSLLLVLASLTPVGSINGLATTMGGRVHPVRTPNGNVVRNMREQVESSNWSGYVVAQYKTGQSYTSATATWTVPAVSSTSGPEPGWSSSWVGIGGWLLNSKGSHVDNTLIQLGTEQDISSSGTTTYSAWYETLPNGPVAIPVTINPGDQVYATLNEVGVVYNSKGSHSSGKGSGGKGGSGSGSSNGQQWTLTMKDITTGQSWNTTLNYNSSLASAEWIEEAPWSGGVLPLAGFGIVTFDPGTVNGVNPQLTSADGVIMYDPNGQTSNVSVPDSDADGFNAAWGNGTTTAVNPPSS